MVFWLLHHLFLDKSMIGGDERYSIYIFWTPVILGIFILGLYRKSFLINKITINEGAISKLISLGFILLQGILFSYLSFGFLAHGIWNQLNVKESETHLPEYIECDIERFWFANNGETSEIRIFFKGELESINVSFKSIREYKGQDPNNYKLVLKVKKGLWDNYIIKNWEIKTFANNTYK